VASPPVAAPATGGGSAASATPRPPVVGNPDRRSKLARPFSIEELECKAAELFGKHAALRFSYKGGKAITDYEELKSVGHGDTIVVTWDDRKLSPAELSYLTTRYQMDYIKHPVQPRPPARKLADEMVSRANGHESKMEGTSHYRDAFTKHPPQPTREPLSRPPNEYVKRIGTTGKSTYKELFPAHPPEPARMVPPLPGALEINRVQRKDGTTYVDHYPWPQAKPPPADALSASEETKAVRRLPFEGVTSYTQAFTAYPDPRPRTSCRPGSAKQVQMSQPSITEYRKEYVERTPDHRVVINLEPDIEKRR